MAVEIIDARSYRVRHIAPTSVWASEGATASVLGQTYGFTELPLEHSPVSAGLIEGSYTGRLGDSGEFSLTFPNAAGAKGLWRARFDADLCREFVEIYRDDVLEFVGSIQRVEIDRGVVTVSGSDAWSLLRRAYERDRFWTAAPRDVIERYTKVPVPTIADDFDGVALSGTWTGNADTVTVADSTVTLTSASGTTDELLASGLTFSGTEWDLTAKINAVDSNCTGVRLRVVNTAQTESVGLSFGIANNDSKLSDITSADSAATVNTRKALPRSAYQTGAFTLQIRSQGRWVFGFIDGNLIGIVPLPDFVPTRIEVKNDRDVGGAQSITIDSVVWTEYLDFLEAGTDKGDYVLPGDLPTGGLRGRYFNDADTQGFGGAIRVRRILTPDREHYAERLDPSMNTASGLSLPVQPGNSGDYFSIRWFGAIYLRGDLGNYTIETTAVDFGCRVWIGKTSWGDQIIDDWTDLAAGTTSSATWDASDHGSQAGWYPIIVEYFCAVAAPVFRLQFTPPGSYTDPGGTSITSGVKITVPSTSLSPLGCYDNRVQGQAYFDLTQGVAQQFGYQVVCEPMQLESGEFPGRLVPRLRVGSDTDVVLEVEDDDAHEPLFSPGVTFDGSEQTTTLIGTGAGLPDGTGSQVTSEVTDIESLGSALFDMQTWVDAADVAFPDLLAARLNAELALRASPWEEVRGTPRAQERLADTWPITGVYGAMRWGPGDGVRIRVPDIGVEDTEPRQLLQVSRTFAADGRTGTQVAFRQRPRSAAKSVRGRVQAALQSQRSYQRQKVTLSANHVYNNNIGAGGSASVLSIMGLLPGDEVVKAFVRITNNDAAQALGLIINGTNRTSVLGGTWSTLPLEINVTAYATQISSTDNRLYAQVTNTGGSATNVDYHLIVEVLR